MLKLALMLFSWIVLSDDEGNASRETLFRHRYIAVQKLIAYLDGEPMPYHHMLRGGILRGMNYLPPIDPKREDRTRLATCYHHVKSPIGQVLRQFDWFPGPTNNTYQADARLPVSLVGLAPGCGQGNLPLDALVGAWSEPPVATVGLYVGTTASYARPLQHWHFYENDPTTIKLSEPPPGEIRYFHYVEKARQRGADVRIFPGDERPTLAAKGPQGFYHVMIVEICPRDLLEDISMNMMTKEGMKLCFDKMTERGILCYHISNRYVDTLPVIADVADSLGLVAREGRDTDFADRDRQDRASTHWVMVARKREYLSHLQDVQVNKDVSWEWTNPTGRHIWTDKGPNDLGAVMRGSPTLARFNDRINALSFRYGLHRGVRKETKKTEQ